MKVEMRPASAVRNNNPGNLEAGGSWEGLLPRTSMSPAQKRERRFAVFVSPIWGFRALAIVLRNYRREHGLDPIRGIVTRLAPPGENDTDASIRDVAQSMRLSADTPLDLESARTLESLCKAIAVHESGSWL